MPETIRVLIADDNASVRFMLSKMLSRISGFEVVGEAETGEGACEAIPSANPDVVLMDVMMGGIGGVEAARRIAASAPHACIIGMSASDDRSTMDAMRDAGADDFVPKAASVDQLVRAIQAAIAVRRFSLKQREGQAG